MGSLNVYQSEKENTINRKINELKVKIDNIKEEVTHDIGNLRKKNETEIQNKKEDYYKRLQQTEERISELEMKWKLKEKPKHY
jgi:uncharacterized coiled-coil protein SlyX